MMKHAMRVAMRGQQFKMAVLNSEDTQFALDMNQETLAHSILNPADALRLMIWSRPGDCLDSDDAAAICEAPPDLFYAEGVPTMTQADWERTLGRLTLSLFASMRNDWRQAQGRDESEFEDVLTAPADFFWLIKSGLKVQAEH
ncbi:hypothetical protein [Ferribacterium limneticum]|uniref:hypothetical protein n=1 Tax=Ferribacterium limneticum TaxID=76259 RepID=UPI001CFA0E4B|nr:hypothetical protein [Ferribacterium limneticum]UCV27013.1 hypothetical protein KI617_11955 [Ferribacterium limneticum]UCV30930.1 hypothetical protein KI608_11955 [Ferribacterium limneticum]